MAAGSERVEEDRTDSTLETQAHEQTAFVSLDQLAEMLGLTRQAVSRQARNGTLPVSGFRVGRIWRFARADVDRLASGSGNEVR